MPHPESDYSLWKATRKFRRAPIPPLPPLLADNRWIHDNTEKVELYADHLQKVFSPHEMPTLPLAMPDNLPHSSFHSRPDRLLTYSIVSIRTRQEQTSYQRQDKIRTFTYDSYQRQDKI